MRKKSLLNLLSVLSLVVSFHTAAISQQTFKTTDASIIGYLEYLPPDYQLNSDKYPVVIFLHGIGERGANTTDLEQLKSSVQKVAKIGPPMYVKNGHKFPFILISPQLKSNYGSWPSAYVMEVINHVKTYLRIDEKRIYLTGLSLGGGGAWWTAQDHPELFAALAPVCGGFNKPSMACAIAAENLPVWAFHGDRDNIVPLSRSVNMVNAINNCQPPPVPQAKMTIYSGVAHDAWTKAYQVDHSIHDPNVYEWMLSFKNTVNGGNKLPLANAGGDKTFSSTDISIIGSGSDPDGCISSYLWKQLAGPEPARMENYTTPTLQALDLKPGRYVFSLKVTDNDGDSDTDYIAISVQRENSPPVVKAGRDTTIFLTSERFQLSGAGSDADGTIVAYSWKQLSGPGVTLTGANTPTLTLSNLVKGAYNFRLTVTDDRGGKTYDDVQVLVKDAVAPVADAGQNKVVLLPSDSVSLSGSGADDDGHIVSYKWRKVSGANCAMTGMSSSTLKISGLSSGSYIFTLSVTDDSGLTDSDEVTIDVTEPPVADAGPDISVTLPRASVIVNGSGHDPDGYIKGYNWTQYSGPAVRAENLSTPALTIKDVKEGTYVFMLTVKDDLNAKATDYVTVTVKNAILTSASGIPDIITEIENAPSSFSGTSRAGGIRPQPVLGRFTALDLEDCLVSIFNAAGKRIFSGIWSAEKFRDTFRERGFYIYHIIKNGRTVNTGKIYIKR